MNYNEAPPFFELWDEMHISFVCDDEFALEDKHLIMQTEVALSEYSNTPLETPHTIYTEQRVKQSRYEWDGEVSDKFLTIFAALGYSNAKPSKMLFFFDKSYNLNCPMIGSHLEKTKIKIKESCENWWDWPGFSEKQLKIAKRFEDPMFDCYSDAEIFSFIK